MYLKIINYAITSFPEFGNIIIQYVNKIIQEIKGYKSKLEFGLLFINYVLDSIKISLGDLGFAQDLETINIMHVYYQ